MPAHTKKRPPRPGEGRPPKRAAELAGRNPRFVRIHIELPLALAERVEAATPDGSSRNAELVRLIGEGLAARES
jgi:hypothetical protein